MYWSREIKRRAAKLFEQGYGYKAVSTQLGVNRETTRDWSYTWRALGSEVLCGLDEPKSYSSEVKLAAVKDREKGIPVIEECSAMAFAIAIALKGGVRSIVKKVQRHSNEARDASLKSCWQHFLYLVLLTYYERRHTYLYAQTRSTY